MVLDVASKEAHVVAVYRGATITRSYKGGKRGEGGVEEGCWWLLVVVWWVGRCRLTGWLFDWLIILVEWSFMIRC